MFNKKVFETAEKIINNEGYSIPTETALELADLPDKDLMDLIFCANRIRERFKENSVFTCAIINAKSGKCSENCAYCAQSSFHDTGVSTYPLMSEREMVEDALKMHAAGATEYSMVTSGLKLTDGEINSVCSAARTMKEKTDLAVCASLGTLTESMAERLFSSGITNYHHNLETARSFFDQICTTHDYQEDIDTVKAATHAGLRVCSGGIMGLGESWAQRVELAETLRDLEVDSIPLNFLNPVKGTRLENRPLVTPMEALKCIALFRFINPKTNITICGGRVVTLKDFQSWVFTAGANGLMSGNYLTTTGRDYAMDMAMIAEMGLTTQKK